MNGLLVIVPCGKQKVWERHPSHGPTKACDAYTGPYFRANKQYAEQFAENWVILSAKYGFIRPESKIEDYDITFTKKSPDLVDDDKLRQQIHELKLDVFRIVIGLGGKEYRNRLKKAFSGTGVELQFPFASLDMFKTPPAIKRAIELNNPWKVDP